MPELAINKGLDF